MAIDENMIEEAHERFLRERDRYEKLTRTVESLCIEHIGEGSALRVNITARTKNPASYARKLRRLMAKGQKPEWESVDDIFNGLSDFSGVRIAYYMTSDAESIKDALKEIFILPVGFDVKDKSGDKYPLHSNYQAIHCQVQLKEDHLKGPNENLRSLSCEIQVCSMMAHVWNEIEHDIGYKPSGVMSEDEKMALARLAENAREGDKIIQRLITAHNVRTRGEDSISSPEELGTFLAELFAVKRVTFRESIGRVYDSLQRIDLCSKNALCKAIGVTMDQPEKERRDAWTKAKFDTNAFNRWLRANGYETNVLADRSSVEPLLVMVLHNKHKTILYKLPAGRGKGRPVWIRGLATRYSEAFANGKVKRIKKNGVAGKSSKASKTSNKAKAPKTTQPEATTGD
jgi:ppGpp synthetase/RelA/SpoT-type nucleotidyltranferase